MNKAYEIAQRAFNLVGATNFRELYTLYSKADQVLMKSQSWDAKNPALVTNQIKILLERMDPTELEEEDRYWRNETLWYWYHHAISWAMCESQRNEFAKVLAQAFASMALSLQTPDHPNKITRLVYLLVHDDIETAEKWWSEPPTNSEAEFITGSELIEDYKAGRLMAP